MSDLREFRAHSDEAVEQFLFDQAIAEGRACPFPRPGLTPVGLSWYGRLSTEAWERYEARWWAAEAYRRMSLLGRVSVTPEQVLALLDETFGPQPG